MPYTTMMGLFYAIYGIYENRKTLTHEPMVDTMESVAGTIAIQRIVKEIVGRSFDDREFRTLRVGEPEVGVIETALIASGRTTGEWPKCLNPLKRSALEDSNADLKEQFALMDETPEDAAAEDEGRRRSVREEGKLVLVRGKVDETNLHDFR